MNFTEFTYPDDIEADVALFNELLAGKRNSYNMEKRYFNKKGEIVWGNLAVSIVRDDKGEPKTIIGMVEDITERKKAETEREKLITDLRNAVTEVKTLSGLLPICSYCKNVRDDKGYWQQVEAYVADHSGAEFTHGICPDCYEKEIAALREKNEFLENPS
jgi:hypothetical protein